MSIRLPSRSYPTGYIPAHSPTSPTSTLRATRAHDADLLIYPFYRSTLGASSRFTGIFLYPMHTKSLQQALTAFLQQFLGLLCKRLLVHVEQESPILRNLENESNGPRLAADVATTQREEIKCIELRTTRYEKGLLLNPDSGFRYRFCLCHEDYFRDHRGALFFSCLV